MLYDFFTADVFTTEMFSGAQIAVFPHAEGLSDDHMLKLAQEMNLTETVFIFPPVNPEHTARMRIFTPHGEIDFAGHPIIATGYVLASLGEIDISQEHNHLRLEQNKAVIDTYVTQEYGQPVMVQFTMQTQPRTDDYLPRDEELAAMLGLEPGDIETSEFRPLVVNSGTSALVVPLKSYRALRAAEFSYSKWSSSSAPSTLAREIFMFCHGSEVPDADFHGRLAGPKIASHEDPPIGTMMPVFASYLCAHPQIPKGTYPFIIARGSKKTRLSLLNVEMDNRSTGEVNIRVGGPAVLVTKGTVSILH